MAWNPDCSERVSFAQSGPISAIVLGPPWLVPSSSGKNGASYLVEGLRTNIPIDSLLAQMDGEFVAMTWDESTQTGVIAADLVGRSILYYSASADRVVWASHPVTVATLTSDEVELNREVLNIYFALKGVPAPWSLLKGVKKLFPGHFLHIHDTGVEVKEYLTIERKTYDGSFIEAQEELIQKIKCSIAQCAESPHPIGVFLSGGLDSTVLTAIAREFAPVRAFSVGYLPSYYTDETGQAVLTARLLNVPIEVYRFSPLEIEPLLDKTVAHLPEPVADMAFLPQSFLASHASLFLKFVLDGTGADAILGGSNKFVAEHYRHIYIRVPQLLRKGLYHLLRFLPTSRRWSLTNRLRQLEIFIRGAEIPYSEERTFFWSLFFSHALLQKVLSADWALEQDIGTEILHNLMLQYGENKESVSRVSFMTLRGITAGVELPKLAAIERVSGLFIHTPFLSKDVLTLALSLPDSYKVSGPHGKVVLREASKRIVPHQTLQRRKMNFSPPIGQWLTAYLRELFWETLSQDEGIFNIHTIRRMWQEQRTGWKDWSAELWAIFMFQYWWTQVKHMGKNL